VEARANSSYTSAAGGCSRHKNEIQLGSLQMLDGNIPGLVIVRTLCLVLLFVVYKEKNKKNFRL